VPLRGTAGAIGNILSKKLRCVKKNGTFFSGGRIYCPVELLKGADKMYESQDPNADLEDLIFEEGSGGPSER